jgi:hypothetical protein
MDQSLTVPTATSVRAIPAKLLIDNRIVINNHLKRTRGGKVSFTHIIGWALVQALKAFPSQNVYYDEVDGKPALVSPAHVTLGLAVDVPKPDGSRALMVPGIKRADTMTFGEFLAAYEDLVVKARTNKLAAEDGAGALNQLGTQAFGSILGAIETLATTGKLSFGSFIRAMLADLAKLAFQLLVIKPLLNGLAGGAGAGGFTGFIGTIAKGLITPSAKGNVFEGGAVTPFATGGIVNSPTYFPMRNGTGLMGEAGPEAILPLRRGPGGSLGVLASGGGTSQVINFQPTIVIEGGNTNEETAQVLAMTLRREMKQIADQSVRSNDIRRRVTA